MSERKLVTVRKITDLSPIPGADFIEVAQIDGWKVVVKKGEFKIGDSCLYFEIDSFLPESDPRFAFLMKSGVRTFDGARGHRLKTVKLRKQISQGLVLPLSEFPELAGEPKLLGVDHAALIGVKKWEPPVHASYVGFPRGARRHGFPRWIRKTDQERCQNLVHEIFKDIDKPYEITEKLDGSSATFYRYNGKVGVCSRNVHLYVSEGLFARSWAKLVTAVRKLFGLPTYKTDPDNAFVRMFLDSGIRDWLLTAEGGNLALQGELIAPGIQGNPHRVEGPQFYLYDVWDIDGQRYMGTDERDGIWQSLRSATIYTSHVPVVAYGATMRSLGLKNVDDLLKFAEGKGLNGHPREGLVFKSLDGTFSFKAISNSYLLRQDAKEPVEDVVLTDRAA
jgi:RNA ligase (TIGR02306 family)